MNADSTTDDLAELRNLIAPLDPAAPGRLTDAALRDSALPAHQLLLRARTSAPASDRPAADRRTQRRRRLVRWAVPGVVVALAGSTAAAAALLSSAPASQPDLVRCYSVARLTDDVHQYTDTSMATAAGAAKQPDVSATTAAALDACSGLWQIGLIRPGRIDTAAPGGSTGRTAPGLTACVLTNGEAAVFPGDATTCGRLGLPQLSDRR